MILAPPRFGEGLGRGGCATAVSAVLNPLLSYGIAV
jgi:hypothetical protein